MRALIEFLLIFFVVGCGNLRGPQGVAGPQGAAGSVGASGVNGQDGATGAVGPQGAVGAQGSQGQQGETGATGLQGQTGAPGAAGANGQDATPVTVVQFCPNVTPVYPTTFPEVAFCLNGTLYGILNNNEAYQYLTELPDGAYSSDGQGAPCSFTISGCEVTY